MCGEKIEGITGEDWVTGVDILNAATGERKRLDAEGIYIRIGLVPNTQFLKDSLTLCPNGQVPVNEHMTTEISGVLAAGDIRQFSPAQIGAAVGDGIHAAMALGRYLNTL